MRARRARSGLDRFGELSDEARFRLVRRLSLCVAVLALALSVGARGFAGRRRDGHRRADQTQSGCDRVRRGELRLDGPEPIANLTEHPPKQRFVDERAGNQRDDLRQPLARRPDDRTVISVDDFAEATAGDGPGRLRRDS